MNSWQAEFGDSFRGVEALVTGATGFIGWHLCRALQLLGVKVTGLSRSADEARLPAGVVPLPLDLTDRERVASKLGAPRYDVAFHLAGEVTGRQDRDLVMPMLEANLLATVNLLDAIDCGRIIQVGSSEEPEPGSLDAPNSPYAASKWAAQVYSMMFHKSYGLPVVSLRLFLTYGPRQGLAKLVPYVITTLLAGRAPVVGSGARVCDAIYVDDAARGMLKAAAAPKTVEGQTFDIGLGTGLTVRDLVSKIAALIDGSETPEFLGRPERRGEANPVARVSRSRAILGWWPSWEVQDALSETIGWYSRSPVAEPVT